MATTDARVKKSISLPQTLLAQALVRAQGQQRSFSSYLASLIAKDIARPQK